MTATEPAPVLLVGASGFVGRHVEARLRAAPGVQVVASTRTGPVAVDLAAGSHAGLCRLLADLRPAAVINCAGATYGPADRMVAGNVTAVARLARAVAEAAPSARLVHVGSAAEYGSHPGPVREDADCRPLGEYGLTKLAGTELLRTWDGLDKVVLRLFNPIGPGSPPTSLLGRLIAELRRGDGVRLGATADVRDFVDIRDAAVAIVAAALTPGPLPAVLNLGSGRPVAVQELIDAMLDVAGAVPVVAAGGASALPWSCADTGAIASALGWRAGTPLRASLAAAWAVAR